MLWQGDISIIVPFRKQDGGCLNQMPCIIFENIAICFMDLGPHFQLESL